MTLTFKRSSLVAQVADAIRAQIMRGAWPEWIPSEREISQTLHVSRNTCRNSLRALRRETLIESVRGRGNRINHAVLRKVRSAAQELNSVGIITPQPMSQLRPQTALVIDELRAALLVSGVRLQLHTSPMYYRPYPGRTLSKLVIQSQHDAWVLLLSTEPLQRWFMRQRIRCIVLGSLHPGVKLPSVGPDHRAICRHAAGRLISLGHRRLIFLNRRSRAAGDLESEAGFLEGVRLSSHLDVDAKVAYHDDTRESIMRLIQGPLFAGPQRPTGMLVANSYCYLSAASGLARLGVRTPEDISIISRDDDMFLPYLEPEPARYLFEPAQTARKTMLLIRPLLENAAAKLEPIRIVSPFVAGGTCRAHKA